MAIEVIWNSGERRSQVYTWEVGRFAQHLVRVTEETEEASEELNKVENPGLIGKSFVTLNLDDAIFQNPYQYHYLKEDDMSRATQARKIKEEEIPELEEKIVDIQGRIEDLKAKVKRLETYKTDQQEKDAHYETVFGKAKVEAIKALEAEGKTITINVSA